VHENEIFRKWTGFDIAQEDHWGDTDAGWEVAIDPIDTPGGWRYLIFTKRTTRMWRAIMERGVMAKVGGRRWWLVVGCLRGCLINKYFLCRLQSTSGPKAWAKQLTYEHAYRTWANIPLHIRRIVRPSPVRLWAMGKKWTHVRCSKDEGKTDLYKFAQYSFNCGGTH
jgi:hypothetical protein